VNKRKICVISGGRADYGLLKPVMQEIKNSPLLELQVIATGSHLTTSFGYTLGAFSEDNFKVDKAVDILSENDDGAISIANSMGKAIIEFAHALSDLKPDLILVLGDRYEILSAVNTALILRIPVAHLCGGDVTEGAFDESIRHSITKCSHLHFVTNKESAQRIIQLGENPNHVFDVGSPGLDNIVHKSDWMSKDNWMSSVGIGRYKKYMLVTFHPATLEQDSPLLQLDALLSVLEGYKDMGIIITGSNADTDGKRISEAARGFAEKHDNVVFHMSLGQERYLNTLKYVNLVVGNSSSGLYETPSFGIPTVNIGTRQKGRLKASSIIDCSPQKKDIKTAIEKALTSDFRDTTNPYGDGNSSLKIAHELEKITDFSSLLTKPFFTISHVTH
jgi:UDP-hydrolysing UDP-N-acetyl-D-glucosamine 2-epimerase